MSKKSGTFKVINTDDKAVYMTTTEPEIHNGVIIRYIDGIIPYRSIRIKEFCSSILKTTISLTTSGAVYSSTYNITPCLSITKENYLFGSCNKMFSTLNNILHGAFVSYDKTGRCYSVKYYDHGIDCTEELCGIIGTQVGVLLTYELSNEERFKIMLKYGSDFLTYDEQMHYSNFQYPEIIEKMTNSK